MSEVTQILRNVQQGDPQAAAHLLVLLYEELRKLAAGKLAREKPGHTLQATALVHEAYLRIYDQLTLPESGKQPAVASRAYIFAAAAQAMRRILIESARQKNRLKHGGDWDKADLDLSQIECRLPTDELLDLHDALEQLAIEDPEKARLVELRFFAELSIDEAAEQLEISSATAKRHWRFARAWLQAHMKGSPLLSAGANQFFLENDEKTPRE
jgi:RNA polymerase sigma factor (TIGR02999 family)